MKISIFHSAITAFFFAISTLAPLTASAESSKELVRYLPGTSGVVLGVDTPPMKGSFLFKELTGWLKTQDVGKDVMGFLLDGVGMDLQKDLEAAVMAQPTASTNPAAAQNADASFVISAKFDEDKVKAAAKKMYSALLTTEKHGLEVFDTGAFEFAFPAEGLIVFAPREDPFGAATWSAVKDEKKAASTDKKLKKLLAQGDTTRGIWLIANTESLPTSGPKMNSAVMSLGITGGLKVEIISNMASKEDAVQSKEQLSALATTGGQNPLIAMLGATPLIANLTVQEQGTRVRIATSMTEPQLRQMVQQVKVMAENPPAMPGMEPGMQPGGPQAGPGAPAAPSKQPSQTSPKDGADADFN